MKQHLFLAALAVSIVPMGGLRAQDSLGFRSPSDNIHCYYDNYSDQPWMRCDMAEGVQTYMTPPPDCDLDWGMSFWIGAHGPAGLTCHGDTVRDPSARVLNYGEELVVDGISCRSEKTGMTCRNVDGHGFSLAKAGQKMF